MQNFFRMERTKAIILSLLMIVFGILFIALPSSFNVMITILASLLIVVGAIWLIDYFIFWKDQTDSTQFVNGIIFIGLGLLMIFKPDFFIAIMGLILAVIGIQYVGASLDEKREKVSGWWKDLIYGLIEFAIGLPLIILGASSAVTHAIMIYFGITLIVDGVFILVAMFTLKKTINNIKKAVK